jgi:hypothetical protein
MSATFRLIDLVTKALAPLVTGQVMTYASTIDGAIFIGLVFVTSPLSTQY